MSDDMPLRVLVYSDDSDVRRQVISALGPRPHPQMRPFAYTECATEPAVIGEVDGGGYDLLILDGEAVPAGGLGIARQLKNEIFQCPAIVVLTDRPQDAWLAQWSLAEASVSHPIDAFALAEAVLGVMRAAHV